MPKGKAADEATQRLRLRYPTPQRAEPNIQTQTHKQQGGNALRHRLVRVERRLDPLFLEVRQHAERRPNYSAECAARHQAARNDDAAVADGIAGLAADLLPALVHPVREKSAD